MATEVFVVTETQFPRASTWTVSGHSVAVLQLGQTVYAHPENDLTRPGTGFEVVEILVRGANLDVLQKDKEARLVLRGEMPEVLSGISRLYAE